MAIYIRNVANIMVIKTKMYHTVLEQLNGKNMEINGHYILF